MKFDVPLELDDFDKIQQMMTDYQIILVDKTNKSKLLYKGEIKAEKKIYLEYFLKHYNAIKNIKAYMERPYYCEECHIGYSNQFKHQCKNKCDKCFDNCDKRNFTTNCSDCNREFYGAKCWLNHLNNNVCDKIKKCKKCFVEYTKDHKCDEFTCYDCKDKYTKLPHHCYMKPLNEQKLIEQDNLPKIIISFDIESSQDGGKHIPNLLICKSVCDHCWDIESKKQKETCSICG